MTRPDTSSGRHAVIALCLLFAAVCVLAAPVFVWLWIAEVSQ